MLDEKKALAILLANFRKGRKISDPMLFAESAKFLVNLHGSPKLVAEKLGTGKEVIRILSKLTELPTEVKELISRGELVFTVAFDLVPLDSSRQIEIAKAVCGLAQRDARKVIRYAIKNPSKHIDEIRREVLEELEKEEIDIVMIGFTRKIHNLLSQESENVPQLVVQVIEDWLKQRYPILDRVTTEGDLITLTIRLPRQVYKALRRASKKPANLVEQIVLSWLQKKKQI